MPSEGGNVAPIPFVYDCSWEAGFVQDPNKPGRFGFVTELKGPIGFTQDLSVIVPSNVTPGAKPSGFTYTTETVGGKPVRVAQVVGVIERLEWNGGVADPLRLEYYVSQANAQRVKLAQQGAPPVKVAGLAWWIADFDQEAKVWFEQAFPINGPVTGTIAGKSHLELGVDLNPVPVKDGIDGRGYKVALSVVPAANKRYSLFFAKAVKKPMTRPWGVVAGAAGSATS
jgi:hypothetical protein